MRAAAERRLDFHAMGSTCRLRIAGRAAGRPDALRALAAAEAEVRRIEQRYSRYREDSVVSRINAAAGSPAWIPLDEEDAALLRFADQLHRASDGLFDISSGVLRRVWDFKAGRRPRPEALAEVLPLIDWGAVEIDATGIRLPRAGMELDFGGIGKEYAADRAASVLRDAGLEHGYVNLGGDLRLLGPMANGQPWRLGIAHPRQPGAVATGVDMAQGALATSGDYERFFEQDGQRYCHILNPRTGWPVAHWQSISVLAPACLAAGALSTVAMLKGPQAPAFLNAQGVAWIAIDGAGAVQRHDPQPAAAPQRLQG